MRSKLMSGLSLATFGLAAFAAGLGIGWEKLCAAEDRVRSTLYNARAAFDREEERLRNGVVDAVQRRLQQATKAGNLAQVEKAQTELDAFMSKNELPTVVPTKGFQEGMRRATVKLKDAYQLAVKQYTQGEMLGEASSTKMELHEFLKGSVIGLELHRKEQLSNPGCEQDLAMGRIPGWLTIRGDWQPAKVKSPKEGERVFYSGNVPDAELQQDVSIRAAADLTTASDFKYVFLGYVRSYRQTPPDAARIMIECRDKANQQVLDVFDSGDIAHVDGWKEVAETRTIPAGTQMIRVRLIARRQKKGTESNDARFDALSLRLSFK